LASEERDTFKPVHVEIAHEIADSLAVAIHQARLLESERIRRKNLELLSQVALSLRHIDKQEILFSKLIDESLALFNADAGAILTAKDDRLKFTYVHGPKILKDLIQEQEFVPEELSKRVFDGKPVYMSDASLDIQEIASTAVLPLQTMQGIHGAMTLYWVQRKEFGEEELGLSNTIADIAGIALQRLQILESLEQQVADRTRELTALYELAALSASNLDLTDLLNQALEKIVSVAYGSSGMIHLLNLEEPLENLVATQGFETNFISEIRNIPQKNNVWGKVIEKGESLLLMDMQKDKDSPVAILRSDLNSYIGAPIKIGDRIIGVISVFYAPDHNPSLDDLSLLNLVADQMGIAVERSQLRQQAEHAAIVEERQRLSRELHDAVTQSLYSLSFLAKASSNFAHSGMWDQATEHLTTIQETAQQALKEMRLLIFELLPLSLEHQGLIEILRDRLSSVEQRSGVQTELSTEGNFELHTDILLGLFRVAQEALNNTLKHASASLVKVRLLRKDDQVELMIEDNGKGFDPEQSPGGMGINSMRQRAEKLGGTLSIKSDLGQGTKVTLVIDEVTP
jgi:signal transduction histidine kinase